MATETPTHADKIERQLASMAHDYRAYFKWDEDRVNDAIETARAKMTQQAKDSGVIRIRYRLGGEVLGLDSWSIQLLSTRACRQTKF